MFTTPTNISHWNRRVETLPREEIAALQLKKIKYLTRYAYYNSPFYRQRFDVAGVKPDDIQTLDDFRSKVPIYRKDDLRELREQTNDPFAGMLTVPVECLEVIHPSTGTSGVPTFVGVSADEVEILSEGIARLLWMWGCRPGMTIYYGPAGYWHWWTTFWSSGLGRLEAGAEMIYGSMMAPVFGVSSSYLAISKFPADVFMTALDVALAIIKEYEAKGLDPKEVLPHIRNAIIVGEAFSPVQGALLKEKFGFDEIINAGGCNDPFWTYGECHCHNGGHAWDDYHLTEIVDPETGKALPPGQMGEFVITNLVNRSQPVLRFGTEDFGELMDGDCPCGRTHTRVKVVDRTIWVLDIGGRKISPYSVRLTLEKHPETRDAAFNIIKYAKSMERLRLKISYDTQITRDPEGLKKRIIQALREDLGVEAEVEWVPYENLDKILHKLVRVVDKTKTT